MSRLFGNYVLLAVVLWRYVGAPSARLRPRSL